MKISYSLNKHILNEYYEYLAMHDVKIQKKLLTLILGISSTFTVISLLIFDLTYIFIIVTLIAISLTFLFFPRLYWKLILDKSNDKVNKYNIKYSNMMVELKHECILVNSNEEILYENIENIGYTNNACLIFYKENNKINSLIVPLEKISDVDEFKRILERKNG